MLLYLVFFDPSLLQHRGIGEAADNAVLNNVHKKSKKSKGQNSYNVLRMQKLSKRASISIRKTKKY
jgi:hypothetical protein